VQAETGKGLIEYEFEVDEAVEFRPPKHIKMLSTRESGIQLGGFWLKCAAANC